MVLVIITALEVGASYLEGDVNSNVLIIVLTVMAAVKFVLVVSWYMHLRTDLKIFRRRCCFCAAGSSWRSDLFRRLQAGRCRPFIDFRGYGQSAKLANQGVTRLRLAVPSPRNIRLKT